MWGEDPSQEYNFAKRQSDRLDQSHKPRPPCFLGVKSLEIDILEWGGFGAGHSVEVDQINHLSKSEIRFVSPGEIGSMNM